MKKVLVLAIGALIMSVSGCAMQADMIDMGNELKITKGMLLEMQRDVTHLQKSQLAQEQERSSEQVKEKAAKSQGEIKETLGALQKNQADFEIRFDQLSTDVQVIQGSLEENSHKMMEFSENMDNQDAAVDELTRKIGIMEARLNEVSASSPKPLSDNTANTGIAAPSITPAEIYNQAYKDYIAGSYDLAITGFTNYLKQSPDGNLVPNAVYWIGESYYSKGDYPNAVNKFKKVTDEYPKNDKVVGALLKMGYAFEKMGNREMSAVYLKKVVEKFPNTQEASLAKVKLGELK